MSKEKRRVPKLRFPGFTEDWEQREFSDIFSEVKSGLSRMLSNDDIGLPVVRANNINDGQLNLVDDIKYWYKNDPQGANTNNYLIEQGDILINFINSEAKMGTAAYVTRRPERDTIYTTNILRCKVNDEYNPYFIYSLTFLNSYKNYIASITKPAVNQASFTTVDFKKYSIKIPTVKEQNQIADLIETFNKLITLHQRKLDNLKLKKKALLQKLFPKNGERYPELRFPGFIDAWEQRKLESLFTKYEDKVNTPNSGYWRLGLRSHCKGTFHTYIDAGNELETAEMNRVKSGNFILNITFAWERALAVTNDEDQDKLVSHRFPQFKPNSDLVIDFFKHTLMDKRFKHHLELSSPGGAGRNKVLKVADMLKYELLVPSIKEQNEISSFLNHVDYIITLHQRKLERLQEVKKGLLQKMFV